MRARRNPSAAAPAAPPSKPRDARRPESPAAAPLSKPRDARRPPSGRPAPPQPKPDYSGLGGGFGGDYDAAGFERMADANDALEALARAQALMRRRARAHMHDGGAAAPGTLLKLAEGVLYVGAAEAKKPHGEGELLLADGSVHAGSFANGRADGAGCYFDRKGTVHVGQWAANKRVGLFVVVGPTSTEWSETYNVDGKRESRSKLGDEAAAAPAERAVQCRHCQCLFHERYNYRCRSHKQPWKRAEWDDPELPDGGLWLCCGAKSFNDPGCHLAIHEAG